MLTTRPVNCLVIETAVRFRCNVSLIFPVRRLIKGIVNNVATLTPMTCKAARAGLDLSVRSLAAMADLSTKTIVRYESGVELRDRTIRAIQSVLEAAGASFLEPDEIGPGLRLRLPAKAEASVSPGA